MEHYGAEGIAPNMTEVQQVITEILFLGAVAPQACLISLWHQIPIVSESYSGHNNSMLCIWTYYLDQKGIGMLGLVNSKKCSSEEDTVNHSCFFLLRTYNFKTKKSHSGLTFIFFSKLLLYLCTSFCKNLLEKKYFTAYSFTSFHCSPSLFLPGYSCFTWPQTV